MSCPSRITITITEPMVDVNCRETNGVPRLEQVDLKLSKNGEIQIRVQCRTDMRLRLWWIGAVILSFPTQANLAPPCPGPREFSERERLNNKGRHSLQAMLEWNYLVPEHVTGAEVTGCWLVTPSGQVMVTSQATEHPPRVTNEGESLAFSTRLTRTTANYQMFIQSG